MKKSVLYLFLLLSCLGIAHKAAATHIYGADFFYTHVSGNTYTISLVVYGDCAGASLSNLYGASPVADIYNGTSYITSKNLVQQGTSTGVEVTPVCPSQLSNTNCVSTTGTVPGVKKFTYTANYTLSTTSANWRFRFDGIVTSTGGQAGRSTSITNISTGSTVIALEATLNNSSAPNSSPVYTTIPTPFFCINIPANYNPGTVDPNGDNLSYSLVPGLLGAGSGGTVSYVTGYSATTPLATSTGAFSFSGTTGQLSFTPNLVQRSLVVNKVEEYRGTTMVGTSMREMTFVVLSSCSNNPPGGSISSISAGSLNTAGTTLTVCKSAGLLTFNINPSDVEGDVINMAVSGVPSGASFTVSSNNTTSPTGAFSWNLATATPGTYNFFITYTDNGCPLSSKQSLAYTLIVLPDPAVSYSLLTLATCTKKATFNVTPSGSPSPWGVSILQGTTTIHSFTGLTGTQLDSLSPGTYRIVNTNSSGCFKDTIVTIVAPPPIIPSVSMVKPGCFGYSDGSITVTGYGGKSPFTYAIGTGSYTSANVFNSLAAGSYTMHVRDANDCIKDTIVQLLEPAQIAISVASTKPRCNYYSSGRISFAAYNGISPYTYALGTGTFGATNSFSGLPSGTYIIHVKDANSCTRDSTFLLKDSIIIHANAVVTNIKCNGNNTGAVTLTGNSGTIPYKYKLAPTGTLSTVNTFTSLLAGTHNFHIEDSAFCYLDTAIALTQPTPITSTSAVTNVLCFGQANGGVIVTPAGGVPPYSFAVGTGTYAAGNNFTGLAAGTYTLHIKDANDCIKDTVIAITQPTVLAISNITIAEPICNNTSTGSITLSSTGGTMPYFYALNANPFNLTSVFTGIAAGTYVMHLKDNNGCLVDSTITVAQPTAIIPSVQVKQSTCSPLNDGRVEVFATGGVPAYQYALNVGSYSTSKIFSSLAAGTYLFRIKDTRGCVKDTTLTIIDSTVVTASYTLNNVKCFSETSGSVIATALTGKSPFTYAINANPFSANNNFTGLAAGAYFIKIKDNLGCTKDTTVPLTEPTRLLSTITVNNVRCFGAADGSVILNGSGGTSPYTFARGTGSYVSSGNIIGLLAGTYVFHVKDANNCIKDTTVTLTQPAKLFIDSLKVRDVLCFGGNSGEVSVYGSGGVPAYTYATHNTAYQTGTTLQNLAIGPVIISLKDANNCKVDTQVTIKQPAKLVIDTADITGPTCTGYKDALVKLNGRGGTLPYQYAIDSGTFVAGNTFSNLPQGTYIFSIKDANNCRYDTMVILQGYPEIVIKDVNPTPVSCFGLSDGSITVNISGGIPGYRYKLGSGSPIPENLFSNLKAGFYKLTVMDSKNCMKDTSVTITSPEALKIVTSATPNDCEGYDNEGRVHAEVTGGTFPYAYKWSDPKSGGTADITSAANGNYMVWVTDANACADSAAADVVYNDCCKIFIPDAFTPNNDGKNDKARILFKGNFQLSSFMIANRFGQVVFETNDVRQGWDGIYKGVPQDIATYNYYAKGICGDSGTKEVEYKGTITLIR